MFENRFRARCKEDELLINRVAHVVKDKKTLFILADKDDPLEAPDDVVVVAPLTGVNHINANNIIYLKSSDKGMENVTSTAQHTMWLLLELAKRERIKLAGKRAAVIGDGRIGWKVYEMLKGFEIEAYIYGPETFIQDTMEDDFYDIVTLHIPLNAENDEIINDCNCHIIGGNRVLINTSRQELVTDKFLRNWLKGGNHYISDFVHKYADVCTDHVAGMAREDRLLTNEILMRKLKKELNKWD